jgi:5-methyltetrahydrofolate--homocysteine methyltransferase
MIGLSGLITPSLEEMAHVAREMSRQQFEIPLLIGGATTSKTHTAVKIAPGYSAQPVVHVLDASRCVGVVSALRRPDQRQDFIDALRTEQETLRQQHHGARSALLGLEQARSRRPAIDWVKEPPAAPAFLGVRVLASDAPAAAPAGANCGVEPLDLGALVPLIDWSPFFHTWELRGRFPSILKHQVYGEQATKLHADALNLLERMVSDRLVVARGVYGFFPANSTGDDLELYSDDTRTQRLAQLHFLRQQSVKQDGQPSLCLADFVAPKAGAADAVAPLRDYIGAFAVTTGLGLSDLCERFRADHDDYSIIMAEALADRLAEAFAEFLHRRARIDLGYGAAENLTAEQLIEEEYRGIRPAPGYAACPDHTEKRTLWTLLGVEARTGIRLTESCAMWPGSSVSGWYFAHPQSRYFAVGKLDRDQVQDYARRKGWTIEEAQRWLGPYLNYSA